MPIFARVLVNTQTCSYSHDDLTRIASANCGSVWSQTFSYDAFGNLSKSGSNSFQPTYSYLTNHMTEIGSSVPSYDGNGNVTNDFLHSYSWDAYGRPLTIDGVGITTDALGRMVEQNFSGTYHQVVYAPDGTKLATMVGQSLNFGYVSLSAGAVGVYTSAGLTYYRHADWLGSSRLASTPSRTIYYDGAYAPFGESYAQSSGSQDYSFTGMNQDTVSALYDFPAREYGIQGRWPSPDPAGISAVDLSDPQTWNRYAYVRNGPLRTVDPSGMMMTKPFGGGGGGLASLFMMFLEGFWSEGAEGGCTADGVDTPCDLVSEMLDSGGASECTNNDCGIGTLKPYQCVDQVCGYMSNQYVSTHENEVNGQLLTDSQYQDYLAVTYASQIANQYNRLSGNIYTLFGNSAAADPNDEDVIGGHANFDFTCDDLSVCGPGRYDFGVHVECASGGYNCGVGDPLVAHDDTVSPWTGNFSLSSILSGDLWEHGFVDFFYGSLCGCVFSY